MTAGRGTGGPGTGEAATAGRDVAPADGAGMLVGAPPPVPRATAGAPPFLLPGSHFGAAVVFLLAGAAGLVAVAPDLARGAFLLPRVVAVVHLFTLGFITTAILGALYQFLPVALGVGVRSRWLAAVTFALHVPGVALLVAGLAAGRTTVTLAGAAGLSAGLLLFAGNLAATLRRAPRGGLTRKALISATVFLVVTVVLGGALAGNLGWGYLGGERMVALSVHLHAAALGWVLMVIVGVSRHLLPMFLLSHDVPEWPGEAAFWLLTAGVGVLVLGHHSPFVPIQLLGALTAGAGVAAFLCQVLLHFVHRRKRDPGPGMWLSAAGAGFLAIALVLAPGAIRAGASAPRLATAYVGSIILGGLTTFVAGHLYRIVPFLTWFHRFGPLVGRRELPTVADLYSRRLAEAAGTLLAGGAAVLLLGVFPLGASAVVRAGAGAFAAGAAVLAWQMAWTFTRSPDV